MDNMNYEIELPKNGDTLSQEEEYFFFIKNGLKQRINLQDYRKVYKVPSLYDRIVGLLKYTSPEVLSSLLVDELEKGGFSVSQLTILELGAGNGLAGECLRDKGVEMIIGVDIIEEALEAVNRERSNVYNRYYIEDFSNITPNTYEELGKIDLNSLVCASALSHIPTSAFALAYNLIENNGWFALNLSNDGFKQGAGKLVNQMIEQGMLNIKIQHNYQHRVTVTGKPIMYTGIVGRKLVDIPKDFDLLS